MLLISNRDLDLLLIQQVSLYCHVDRHLIREQPLRHPWQGDWLGTTQDAFRIFRENVFSPE